MEIPFTIYEHHKDKFKVRVVYISISMLARRQTIEFPLAVLTGNNLITFKLHRIHNITATATITTTTNNNNDNNDDSSNKHLSRVRLNNIFA